MVRSMFNYGIIVKSKTRLEKLIEKHNSKSQASFVIQSQGGDFSVYEEEHVEYEEAIEEVQKSLSQVIKTKLLDKSFVSQFLFSEKHIVIVVGQDGLLANVAKYAKGQPIIGVNPSPERFMGVLLKWNVKNFIRAVEALLSNKAKLSKKNFAQATLHNGQRILAFNDIFIGMNSHASADYAIKYNGCVENQSSSGVIISTAQGLSGWMSSIFNMVDGIADFKRGDRCTSVVNYFDYDIKHADPQILLFCVREPYMSQVCFSKIVMGKLASGEYLELESKMPENGVIFSDGVQSDFISFCSGDKVSVSLAPEFAFIVERS